MSFDLCSWCLSNICVAGKSESKDLNPIILNIAINGAGIVGTNWLFQRDLKARRRDRASVEREEALARLQVSMCTDRQLVTYATYLSMQGTRHRWLHDSTAILFWASVEASKLARCAL